jgi:hypothetical protein
MSKNAKQLVPSLAGLTGANGVKIVSDVAAGALHTTPLSNSIPYR